MQSIGHEVGGQDEWISLPRALQEMGLDNTQAKRYVDRSCQGKKRVWTIAAGYVDDEGFHWKHARGKPGGAGSDLVPLMVRKSFLLTNWLRKQSGM